MLSPTNDWGSLTEDRLRRGNAAWQWLRSWISGGRVGSLESAMFCRLTSVGILLRKQSNTSIMYACLGHFTWACLVFPMVSDSTQQNMLLLKQGGHLDWLHIVNPHDWEVLPFENIRVPIGLVFMRTAEAIPLVKWSLTHCACTLTVEDLQRVWKTYNDPLPDDFFRLTKRGLIERLADRVSEHSQEFKEEVLWCLDNPEEQVANVLAKDEMVQEALGDLPPEEQKEYGGLLDEIKNQKRKRKFSNFANFGRRFDEAAKERKARRARTARARGRPAQAGCSVFIICFK